MKKLFPEKEGSENFVGFEDIYDKYEQLGFSRKFFGDLYRLKRSSCVFGKRSDYTGGPYIQHQKMKDRNRLKTAGGKRMSNLA